ncbi:MAG: hypothetical protein ACLPX5_01960 [Dissulfurispiraceae bacterium]
MMTMTRNERFMSGVHSKFICEVRDENAKVTSDNQILFLGLPLIESQYLKVRISGVEQTEKR